MRKLLNNFSLALRIWLLLAILATLFYGLAHGLTQNVLRSGANDPQIQMARDAALATGNNQIYDALNQSRKVDPSKSLAPFLIIFNDAHIPLTSSAILNDKTPIPPSGVFDYVRLNGEDRFTWQPQPGVRIAAVMTRYEGKTSGFVLAGRSLTEVEIRESNTFNLAAFAWLITLALGALASWLLFGRTK